MQHAGKCDLGESAQFALNSHGIGSGSPPKSRELWEQFLGHVETEKLEATIENRFDEGFSHGEINWKRPVHGIFTDFKGDSMQIGMLLQRLRERGEQYIFVGNPVPFNGGWHFTAVDDFEHPTQQKRLDPSWRSIRIWTRVNYVPTLTEAGLPALTPREAYSADNKHAGAIPLDNSFRLTSLFFTGGLMPHTMNATSLAEGSPGSLVVKAHFELGSLFGAIGHGLDILIASGTKEQSLFAGFTASGFPKQEHLLQINGFKLPNSSSLVSRDAGSSGAVLVSVGYWGEDTAEAWLEAVALGKPSGDIEMGDTTKIYTMASTEAVFLLDTAKLPSMDGPFFSGEPHAPEVVVFVDEVADPVEIYVVLTNLMKERFKFQLVSRSVDTSDNAETRTRRVKTETVFGNPMYALRDCCCVLTTTPANLIAAGSKFDGFFVVGGQSPYHMLQDGAVTALMDTAEVAAAVCHGPEALIGSKWLSTNKGKFTCYTGAWMSFRDILERFEQGPPGHVVGELSGCFFSGNTPPSTQGMVERACAALRRLKASTQAASAAE